MSSILTNNSAMVALQTLKSVNMNLANTQTEISTGKSVGSAKDNAAVWAISKQMDSDVKGFQAISESLNLGEATVATALNASETVTDLLIEMKGRIVAAQEENVDRNSIQADIVALREQIGSVVGAAQFNGLNLIDASSTDSLNILSSLDRDSSGNLTASQIEVSRQNLAIDGAYQAQSLGTGGDQAAANGLISGTGVGNARFGGAAFNPATAGNVEAVADGATMTVTIEGVADGATYTVDIAGLTVSASGGSSATGATRSFTYVANANDDAQSVATELTGQINAFFGAATPSANAYSVAQGTTGATNNTFTITNGAAGGVDTPLTIGIAAATGGTAGSDPSAAGLAQLQTLDVSTTSGATSALSAIDNLIDHSIGAAAAFGSVQGRIETQNQFVSELTDSLKSGIGSLVDADMEEASAKLQALQVQQQLAVQALSIANQAPQSILSLFR